MNRTFRAWEQWISPRSILASVGAILLLSICVALGVTAINWAEYRDKYYFCLALSCFAELENAFAVQRSIVIIGANVAIFVALILTPYIALRSYISTTGAQIFGNNLSHLGFFERFLTNELGKRDRISAGAVDVYSLYRLIFPGTEEQAVNASKEFIERVRCVVAVICITNDEFLAKGGAFDFSNHRKRMICAFAGVHIKILTTARIDFLESEDELLDFLDLLWRVFCSSEERIGIPERAYR